MRISYSEVLKRKMLVYQKSREKFLRVIRYQGELGMAKVIQSIRHRSLWFNR